ncbi:MAG TPA: hypothetical protein VF611_07930 [Pyrinomonadaceae bacterium]|jgi:hypothetical protein
MYRHYSARVGVDTHYHRICKRHLRLLGELESNLEALKKKHPSEFEAYPEYSELTEEAEECSSIVIVFAAMCLEAFIYDYGAVHTSDSYMENYVDKLSPVAKWVVVTKLVTGKDFPTDSQAFQMLRTLMKARNDMVHFKSFDVPVDDLKKLQKLMNKAPIISAQDAFKAISLVMIELEKLDPGYGKTVVYLR